jgi:putative N6-adenine-specific DNA methylase
MSPYSLLEKRLRRQIKSQRHTFWATCTRGLEEVSVQEGLALGLAPATIVEPGLLCWNILLEEAWKLNACSRTLQCVYWELAHFNAKSFAELEQKVCLVPWELYLPWPVQLKISIKTRTSRLYHKKGLEERLQKWIFQSLNEFWANANEGGLADFASQNEAELTAISLLVHIENNACSVRLNLSGEALDRRGYDKFVEQAPLRDNVVAALYGWAGWNDERGVLFLDPMCGAGTFTLEHFYQQSKLYPFELRHFALEALPSFREAAWNHLCQKVKTKSDGSESTYILQDISAKAIKTTVHNLEQLKVPQSSYQLIQGNSFHSDWISYMQESSLPVRLAINPPWGLRLAHEKTSLQALHQALKQNLQIWLEQKALKQHVKPLSLEILLVLPVEIMPEFAKLWNNQQHINFFMGGQHLCALLMVKNNIGEKICEN